MWKSKLLAGLVVLSLALAACAQPIPQAGEATDAAQLTPQPQETASPLPVEPEGKGEQDQDGGQSGFPAPVRQARQALATELGLAPSDIKILSADPAEWPDTCLGLPRPEEVCAEMITSGYGGLFQIGDEQWEFRVDSSGEIARFIPGAVLSVRQVLGQQMQAGRPGMPQDAVRVISFERVTWPDSCLGIQRKDVMCAQAETPGYRIVLEFEGQRYEYHSDQTGGTVLLAQAPEVQVGEVALTWELQSDAGCQSLQAGAQELVFGPCAGPLMSAGFVTPLRASDLAEFASTYASFEADTPAGSVTLTGAGTREATAPEQRMIAEWARLVFMEAEGGRSGASWGLALAWHREGGIAGFCNDLTVYLSGEAYASSCRGNDPQDLGRIRLSAEQLAQVYGWVDAYQSFDVNQEDPPVPDQMVVTLTFFGTGTEAPSEQQQNAVQDFAARLYTQVERDSRPDEPGGERTPIG